MEKNFVTAEPMSEEKRTTIVLNGVEMQREENGEYSIVKSKQRAGANFLLPMCACFLAVFALLVAVSSLLGARMSTNCVDKPPQIEDVSRQEFANYAAEWAAERSGKPWITKADAAEEEDLESLHTVTVLYLSYDGAALCQPTTMQLELGERFTIFSPVIVGYIPHCDCVEGCMGGRDVSYVVYYAKAV